MAGALESFFAPISGIVGQTAQEGFQALPENAQKQIVTTASDAYKQGKQIFDSLDPEAQRQLENL